jgi:L-malate glycosyltransferase
MSYAARLPVTATTRRRRLLVVTNTLRGGTGAHLVRFLGELDRSVWQVQLVCLGSQEFEPAAHIELVREVTRGRLQRFPFAQWRQLRLLARIAADWSPDVVHTFFFWPILYGRILKGLGRVRHVVENREDQGFVWSPSDYRLLRATRRVPDRIVCVSEAVRTVVLERERVAPERTEVIRNGISVPAESMSAAERAAARGEFGFAAEHDVVGMVANLDHEIKGARYFVEAVPEILRRRPAARFLVLGEGRLRQELLRRARELGVADRIVFAGFRSDTHRLYPLMDVSGLTSLSEGLSITLLESMSHGLAVAATAVGGNPELIEAGRSGLLVPPADAAAFAAAVVQLLENPARRRALGEAARERVRSRFSLAATVRRYEELYERVLDGSAASRQHGARHALVEAQ